MGSGKGVEEKEDYAWFPPFRCRSVVAVSMLPLRKFRKNSVMRRKNYVAYVKNSVAPLPFQLPLRRNRRSVYRIESYFCRSSVAGQPISVLVIVQTPSTASTERRHHQFRSHAQRKLTVAIQNGTTATVERNGETATAARQRNGGNQA